MSLLTLRDRGVDANPVGAALLRDHRLAFTLPSERWTGRAADILPKQGIRKPWKLYQNYFKDTFSLKYSKIDDGVLEFK